MYVTHPKIFVCKESFLCADPCIPLFGIPQENLQVIALAE